MKLNCENFQVLSSRAYMRENCIKTNICIKTGFRVEKSCGQQPKKRLLHRRHTFSNSKHWICGKVFWPGKVTRGGFTSITLQTPR